MQIDPRRQQAAVSSQEAERAAREAAVAYARQQATARARAVCRRRHQPAGDGAGRDGAAHRRGEPRALSAQVQQQQVQLRYFTVTAPTAGIVGDVPVRVGNQVSTQTMLTTIDQNETLEVYVPVPIERAGALRKGLPIQILGPDGARRIWGRRSWTSSRRAWTIRRSRCS